jgi:hypothetical protein
VSSDDGTCCIVVNKGICLNRHGLCCHVESAWHLSIQFKQRQLARTVAWTVNARILYNFCMSVDLCPCCAVIVFPRVHIVMLQRRNTMQVW